MSASDRAFLDTNVLLYMVSWEPAKAARARALIADRATVSAQVLNEFTSVSRGKLKLEWAETCELLDAIRQSCSVVPVTEATHDLAVELSRRFGLHIYDANIVAAAGLAGCTTLYSEDMQHGQAIAGLRIENPFAGL